MIKIYIDVYNYLRQFYFDGGGGKGGGGGGWYIGVHHTYTGSNPMQTADDEFVESSNRGRLTTNS